MADTEPPKVIFPKWAAHENPVARPTFAKEKPGLEKQSIWSVDVHPDGTRVATGGSDGYIRIWSLEALVTNQDAPATGDDMRQLAMLCFEPPMPIKCVRWSPNGVYLATGADNGQVCIWHLMPGTREAYGRRTNYENWEPICSPFRAHSMEVMDIAWSPTGKLGASCSLDNDICIWSPEQKKIVNTIHGAHASYVMGLAWDPMDKMLASHGEDKTLKFWDTSTFGFIWECKKPYRRMSSQSFVRRMSWDPIGSHVITSSGCSGVNAGKRHVAPVISRSFSNDAEVRGHSSMITCVRHCPTLFYQNDLVQSVFAMAAMDQSVSVWTSGSEVSLVCLLADLFSTPNIFDLSWEPNGRYLFAVGEDSTMKIIQFGAKTFGEIIPLSGKKEVASKMYSSVKDFDFPDWPAPVQVAATIKRSVAVPTDIPVSVPVSTTSNAFAPSATSSSKKKRIVPQLLSAPAPAPTPTNLAASEIAEEEPKARIPRNLKLPRLMPRRNPAVIKAQQKQKQRQKRKLRTEQQLARKRRKLADVADTSNENIEEHVDDYVAVEQEPSEPAMPSAPAVPFEAIPQLEASFQQELETEDGVVKLVIETNTMSVSLNEAPLFSACLPDSARVAQLLATGVVVVTCDNRLSLYSYNGARLCPPLLLSSELVGFKSNEQRHFCTLDLAGRVMMFEVSTTAVNRLWKARFPFPTLNVDIGVSRVGVPVFVVETGDILSFDASAQMWNVLLDRKTRRFLAEDQVVCGYEIGVSVNRMPMALPSSGDEDVLDINTLDPLAKLSYYETAIEALNFIKDNDYGHILIKLIEQLALLEQVTKLKFWADQLVTYHRNESFYGISYDDAVAAFGPMKHLLEPPTEEYTIDVSV